jgi:hypothetical protein
MIKKHFIAITKIVEVTIDTCSLFINNLLYP